MKILIIRFSSIGDIVLTTPVIRCLKLQTDATIHFLTKKSYEPLLIANPYISKIYTIDKKIEEIKTNLVAEKYDYVIDLHHNLRTWKLKRVLKTKSFSFDKLNMEKWLLTNFKINRLPNVHIVDRYLKTVESLGVSNDGAGLDYFIPKKDDVNPSEYNPILKENNYIVFTVGAGFETKRLPNHKIISICNKINQPIVLIGGKREIANGKAIEMLTATPIISLCGKLNLNQSASLIQQAKSIIAHDTGMMHIAAALKKKVISIWGNTTPDFGMYPYYPENSLKNIACHTIIEVKQLSCRPCSKLGYNSCPKRHFNCMELIDEIQIIAAL